MSDPSDANRGPDHQGAEEITALSRQAIDDNSLGRLAEGAATGETPAFSALAEESIGFAYLADKGADAVMAFKLLERAHSQIGRYESTAELNLSEWRLLQQMLGSEAVDAATRAYFDCKAKTADIEGLTDLDERMAWRLSEFVHLYESVILHGRRSKALRPELASRVLGILLRDFGEYYGLLCDDVDDSKADQAARLARYLVAFRRSPLFQAELPVGRMTRLALSDEAAKNLLDYEIARGLLPHVAAVKERIIRGDAEGNLSEEDPVELNTHTTHVIYARDLDSEGAEVVNAILPVFAEFAFEGFGSLADAEAYVARRREAIKTEEQECFALLRCLSHFEGRIPPRMKEFRARDVMRAARKVYREKEKKAAPRRATTARGLLKERLSGAWQAVTRTVSFKWPENRSMYRIAGYPESVVFFPQEISVREGQEQREYVFLCHTHHDVDPDGETPLMYEYQAVIEDTLLFDCHAAARDRFAEAPATFKRTLDAGPFVTYAKTVLHPGEEKAVVDMEENKLLGTYVALQGGMKSWVGQMYLLSETGADAFSSYPDVQAYVAKSS